MSYQSGPRSFGTRQNIALLNYQLSREAQTALDIGCNEGRITAHLENLGLEATGFEASKKHFQAAKRFFEDNGNTARLENKKLELADIERLPGYDVILFLSVYHQIVQNESLDYANELLKALYRKCNLQLFFQPCTIYEKHGREMPFIENDLNSIEQYFTSIISETGEPVHISRAGISINMLPVHEPNRPLFVFSKRPAGPTRRIQSMQGITQEPTSETNLLHIAIEDTLSAYDLQAFSRNACWHRLVQAALETGKAIESGSSSLNYETTSLYQYYRSIVASPAPLWEQFGVATGANSQRVYTLGLPWEQPQTPSLQAFIDSHSADAVTRGGEQLQLLAQLYEKISEEGYCPELYPSGYVSGYVLQDQNHSKFIVTSGAEQLAILSAMDQRWCLARFANFAPRLVNPETINSWPQVALGNYSKQEALEIFHNVFTATGQSIMRQL